MKEKYEMMLSALHIAASNVDNLMTPSELSEKVNFLASPKSNLNILKQAMALRDSSLRLRELLTLVSGKEIEWDLPKKEVLIMSAKHFEQNRAQYLNLMEYLGDKAIRTHTLHTYAANVGDHLSEITELCNQLSKDYINEG